MHTVDGIYQGSRTHVLEIFSRVIPFCPKIDFYFFLKDNVILKEFSDKFTVSNVKIVHISTDSKLLRLLWFFPRMQKKYKLDYFHSQYIFPFPMYSKGIVTIHDILFETHPKFFSLLFRMRSKLLIKNAAQKAKHIFTVSNYTKKMIIQLYKISANKITVIYNAVSERYNTKYESKELLSKLGLVKKKYLLTVGRYDPRKNIITLLKEYSLLPENTPPLIIVSNSNIENLNTTINKFNLSKRVKILSNISDKELPILYQNALVFIYPSYAEGFGMPILEAMASGTCVITSKTTAMLEVAKDSAILINPNDRKELGDAIKSVISDTNKRKIIEKKGLARTTKFSWDDSAMKVANLYNSLIDS